MYEPAAKALSSYLLMALPSWTQNDSQRKNWKEAPSHRGQDIEAVSDPFQKDERG